ncbi:GNAT family N-acetyltransferase [Paenibacillus hexagrammi]|uniref:N-acetyltransferase family protein n=1 Tax=Paenibacillus hexagrammi TaxID=2908839 RepID=A0ABY3SPW5_9BACL|nr:GNAT family N-acetyltransferase [Paenibacillus sp. YPD9-1]UJF35170.1 N-acetyltransferase family protein [Paenibacillus sp. YPD9-1]
MTNIDINKLTIRDANLEDLAEIVRIYNSTVAGRMVTADTEPVPVSSRERWFHEHSPDFRPLWVLEQSGKICGWLCFQSFYGRPAYQATAEVSIYLDEACRGQGIGRFLLQQAIDACPKLNIKTLLGFIFGHNDPSLKLFKSFGFDNWAQLPRIAELDGIERDLIIVGKRVLE